MFGEPSAIVLGSILSASSILKVRSFALFREQVADYELIPYRATGFASAVVVASESMTALLLFIPRVRQVGGAVALALFSLFLVVLVLTLRRGRAIACGCFGGSGELDTVGAHSVLQTALFAILAVIVIASPSQGFHTISVLLAALMALIIFLAGETVRLFSDVRASLRLVRANPGGFQGGD